MYNPPTENYCGLTIILDHPSRFDRERLLYGLAGQWIEEAAIKPYRLTQVDLRDSTENARSFLPDTRFVAWMGLSQTTPCGDDPCGYITTTPSGIRHVQTWHPQDALDPKQYESVDDGANDDSEEDYNDLDIKNAYPTRRTNYKFWTEEILQKLLNPPKITYEKIQICTHPSIKEVTKILDQTRDEDLYLDIETSPAKRAIQCIGFSTSRIFPRIYCVPLYLYNQQRAYSCDSLFAFHRGFSRAIQRNTVVIHNSLFDLLILHAWYKFHLPLSNPYDTMLAGHRCHLESEKSLSHNIVRWTELPYHKISSVETFNAEQQHAMWHYNCHDVYALHYISRAQMEHAATRPGLLPSIVQVNASILPYLSMTLEGLTVDRVQQLETEQRLELSKRQFHRICKVLAADDTFNPGSSKQCAHLLHDKLGYAVAERTEKGAPKLGKKQFYQLLLKYRNPIINGILAYRKTAKDLSMLAFPYWSTPAAAAAQCNYQLGGGKLHMTFQ